MLIITGKLAHNTLAGQVALVTGAGGGIGFEAARSLIWLGAQVVIAEIDETRGRQAEKRLLHDMAAGYVKDPQQRDEQLGIVSGWPQDVEQLQVLLNGMR